MDNKKREEYLEGIMKSFEADTKRKQVWVLKNSKGEILRMRSGKSSWRQRNHATSALVNHIYLNWKDKEDVGFRNEVEVKDHLIETGQIIVEQIF